MAEIIQLDKNTIDQIAAGEVIENPTSVVKELVENAIDAGSTLISVEIREGGTALIRVTDNGMGIDKTQVRKAFFSHATSKIKSAADLFAISSLGFRGEALSSIAAVAEVEMITKTPEALIGVRYLMNGSKEEKMEEVGAPSGTSVMVRHLFYNTPARKKFLKKPRREGAAVGDLLEKLALDNPHIAFHLINDKKEVFSSSGSGDLKELIYRIYGKEIAGALIPLHVKGDGMALHGFLGEPVVNRANRNQELFFVNGRYVRNSLLSRALEEGYQQYLMQHRFPFAVLFLELSPDLVDVNAHPSKMEVRFHEPEVLYEFIRSAVEEIARAHEMIPEATLEEEKKDSTGIVEDIPPYPQPFEVKRLEETRPLFGGFSQISTRKVEQEPPSQAEALAPADLRSQADVPISSEVKAQADVPVLQARAEKHLETASPGKEGIEDWFQEKGTEEGSKIPEGRVLSGIHSPGENPSKSGIIHRDRQVIIEKNVQMEIFDDKMLSIQNRSAYKIIGQVFDTYWIVTFQDKMFLIDQHAVHEKVNYERMMKRYANHEPDAQILSQPILVTLTAAEEALLLEYQEHFSALGFELEPFGAHTYAIRAVPVDLYGQGEKALFLSILDDLSAEHVRGDFSLIVEKIASMACKASVKGNTAMNHAEIEALIDELLTLENPYNCPHGRPTIISMSKYELDKKFKRIVS